MFERRVMQMFYDRASSFEELPWHADEATTAMRDVVAKRKSGRALDVGCGAGNESMFFAKRGFEVTGIDFIPQAIELASSRARVEGLEIEWIETDVMTWRAQVTYDVVIDRGCMHSLGTSQLARYKSQLLSLLAPGADYVLMHFDKRFLLDWHPLGPRRRTADSIRKLLAPELKQISFEQERFALPFPITNALGSNFLFQRVG